MRAPNPGSPSMLVAFLPARYSTSAVSPFASAHSLQPITIFDEVHERHRVAARRRDAVDVDLDDRRAPGSRSGSPARARRTPAIRARARVPAP